MTEFTLQRFAEGEGAEVAAPAEQPASNGDTSTEPEIKTELTEIDVDAKINAALSKMKAQMDADYKKREAAAKKEAERLGKLSDEERQKAELESVRKELDDQRAEFEREKLKYETAQVLGQRKMSPELAEFVIAEDSEATLARIKLLEKIINKGIQDGVNDALKGKAPASGGKIDVASVSTGKVSRGFIDAINSKKISI